jgi:succinate-semialdehyde dehydrogenase/glutarate-semialdehyde dehydrogenase
MSAVSERATAAEALGAVPTQLLIGDWRRAAGGATFPVEDPASGATIAHVADGDAADALDALAEADRMREPWAATPARERADVLRAAYEAVTAQRELFATVISLEMGKPLAEARGEVDYGADYLRWFAEEAVRIGGRVGDSPDGRQRMVVTREPVGPCLLITPWNFPLAMATRKLAPAFAAGCTAVLKPAAQTPLTALLLARTLLDAGLPAGVLSVVTTSRSGAAMAPVIADGRLRKLSFTGSTEVGRGLLRQAAERVLRCSMELGGNAPFLVFADADLDAAVEGALLAKLRNGGQACTAANRFLVERPIADAFAQALGERMAAQVVGPGDRPDVQVGPLIDGVQRERVARLVQDACREGARVLAAAQAPAGGGHYYPPTLLTDVPTGAMLLREEIFGPVAPVIAFDGEDEAVRLANATEHGLVAYVWSRDLDRALRLSRRLETGMVGINQGIVSNAAAPFGGVKASGIGREGGAEGIEEYLEVRYAALRN